MKYIWIWIYKEEENPLKINYKSIGYPVICKCGEWSKWHLILDSGEEIYVCERCYYREWKSKIRKE